jgi:2'-5' RNA ligase
MGTTIGVAIDIPEPWGGQLTARRAAAGDPLAAHVPAHLTLLGPTEIGAADLSVVEEHLVGVAADQAVFWIHLRGTGTFRPVTQVVFVSVASGIGECEQLHEAVLAAGPISRLERFPYHPHVTVAHDVPEPALDAAFEDLAEFEAVFAVDGFALFEHDPQGRWRKHRDYRLSSGARSPQRGSAADRRR